MSGNVFVIGYSQSGKSTVARWIAKTRGMQLVSAGGWARAQYLGEHEDPREATEHITAYAVAVLRAAPLTAVEWITGHDLTRPTVIEGIRNPSDFVRLFDPTRDEVLHLSHVSHGVSVLRAPTVFDRGVDVISEYCWWLIGTKLMQPWRYQVDVWVETLEEC